MLIPGNLAHKVLLLTSYFSKAGDGAFLIGLSGCIPVANNFDV